jgi:hypothetical protein
MQIEDIKKIKLGPDDCLIFKYSNRYTAQDIDGYERIVKDMNLGCHILFVPEDIKVEAANTKDAIKDQNNT